MSTNTTVSPEAKAEISPALSQSIATLFAAEGKAAVAFDGVRKTALKETKANGWTEKQLTGILLDAGIDPARTSEIKGFVFPAHQNARVHLDEAMKRNAKETDIKKRVPKGVILALQRDKKGELTLAQAIKNHTAAKSDKDKGGDDSDKGGERQPGGKTDVTEKTKDKAKKKTPEEIEAELLTMIAAAMSFAKANGYDADDFGACVEQQAAESFAEADEDEDEDEDGE